MPYEEIVRNLRKKFPRTASTGIRKTRLASGTVRFADLLLKIEGTCSRGHDTPAKTSNHTRHISTTTDCVFTIGPAIEFLQVISVKPVQYMCVFASPVELSIMWLFLEHTSISAL